MARFTPRRRRRQTTRQTPTHAALRQVRLGVEQLENRRMLAGVLDPFFGTGGIATFSALDASDMALQPDGKIVVVGSVGSTSSSDAAVARYNNDGTLDTTFDGDGVFTLSFDDQFDSATAVALQADGKIVVAVWANDDFGALRLNANGSPDVSFGPLGARFTSIGPGDTFEYPGDILVQNDGKIIIVGGSHLFGERDKIALVRYSSGGILDTTFGSAGIATAPIPADYFIVDAHAVLQSDGKILVTGLHTVTLTGDLIVNRFNANGSVDSSFGINGSARNDMGGTFDQARSLAVQPDGKILLTGPADSNFGVLRLLSSGVLDPSFGTAGKIVTNLGGVASPGSIAVLADGKFLVGGTTSSGPTLGAVVRYNASGAIDVTFGGGGVATFGGADFFGEQMAVQTDGKILSLGFASIARLLGEAQTRVELIGNDLVVTDVRVGGKADRLKVSYVGGKVRIEDLNNLFITTLLGTGDKTPLVEVSTGLFTGKVIVNTLGGEDKLILGSTVLGLGRSIDYNGGTNVNLMAVQGSGGGTSATYAQGTSTFAGQVLLNASIAVNLTGIDVVDVSGFNAASLLTPPAVTTVSLTPGVDAVTGVATVMKAATAGQNTTANFFNNTSVTIDMSAAGGPSSINLDGTISSFSNGNGNLTLRTPVTGEIHVNSAPSGVGTFNLDTRTVYLNAPMLFATIVGHAQTTYVGGVGQIQQAIQIANPAAVVYVMPGTYVGSVNASGKSIVLAPGPNGVGRVNIVGDLTLDGNDSVDVRVNGGSPTTGYGSFIVTGSISLGGAALSIAGSYKPVENLTIIRNDGVGAVVGAFAAPNNIDGATVLVNGAPMTLRYAGGDGNDVALIDVNQPTVGIVSRAGIIADTPGGGVVGTAVISGNGRYVALVSSSPNLLDGFQFDAPSTNVYRYDRQTGAVVLVSVGLDGSSGGNAGSHSPSISDDGNIVAFVSQATNLDTRKSTSTFEDIFVRSISAGVTQLVSKSASGSGSGNGLSAAPRLSPNGQTIAYESRASNLHPLDATTLSDVYAYAVSSGANSLVSVNKTNSGAGNNGSFAPSISANGQRVAFFSVATDLHALDMNSGFQDVFMRDLFSNLTTLVSINQAGTASASGGSFDPVISADGNVVAFRSTAIGMEPLKQATGALDVFVRNLSAGVTKLVSVNTTNNGGGNNTSYRPQISADGNIVAYHTDASNLHVQDGDNIGDLDVLARNVSTNTTYLVSTAVVGGGSGNGSSELLSLSGDGSRVAFSSSATNLHPLDMSAGPDVYVRNLATSGLSLVNKNAAGTAPANGLAAQAMLSSDGSTIVFASFGTNLTSLVDQNGNSDVFTYSMADGAVGLVSRRAPTLPSQSGGGSTEPSSAVSANGRYIAFASKGENFVGGYTYLSDPINPWINIYRYDRLTGQIKLVSVSSDGLASGNSDSNGPVISDDGNVVAYSSYASNLAPHDANGSIDIFARNLTTGVTYLVSGNATGQARVTADPTAQRSAAMAASWRLRATRATSTRWTPMPTTPTSSPAI